MAKIFLVRHGETDWNKQEIFRGTIDVPLNDVGLKQADLLGQALKKTKMSVIYTSELSRAYQTASAIAEYQNVKLIKEQGFNDMCFGLWEGKTLDMVKKDYPELYNLWKTKPHKAEFPSGENLDMVKKRVKLSLNKIIKNHFEDNVVISSHRVITKVLLCYVLGLSNSHFWQIKQDNCCLNIIEYSIKDGFTVNLINDTCHLKELKVNKLGDF